MIRQLLSSLLTRNLVHGFRRDMTESAKMFDKIPKGYPQEQGKVEAYNKIVIAEFLQIEELKDEKDGAEKYESFVNSYNYEREHGGINGMTPAEKFMKCLKQPLLIH